MGQEIISTVSRYNPISRGGYANHNQPAGAGGPGKGGYNPSGFSRGAFSGTRGMPARGGFSRGGSRGGTWS